MIFLIIQMNLVVESISIAIEEELPNRRTIPVIMVIMGGHKNKAFTLSMENWSSTVKPIPYTIYILYTPSSIYSNTDPFSLPPSLTPSFPFLFSSLTSFPPIPFPCYPYFLPLPPSLPSPLPPSLLLSLPLPSPLLSLSSPSPPQLDASAYASMMISYYSSNRDAWEPILEPVIDPKNEEAPPLMWFMKMHVCV